MKKEERKKNAAKKKLSTIITICHACAFLLREITRGLFFLSFPPTLGIFVVQSRDSRDSWESTWKTDSRWDRSLFSTGKCRDAFTCTYVNVYPRVRWNATNRIAGYTKIIRKDCQNRKMKNK